MKEDRIPDSIYEKMIEELEILRNNLNHEIKESQYGQKYDKKGKIEKSSITLPKLTLTVSDSAWLTKLIYEDVERGVFTSQITTTQASNCVELNIDLIWTLLIGTPVTVAVSTIVATTAKRTTNYLIDQITTRINKRISEWKKKNKVKKIKE